MNGYELCRGYFYDVGLPAIRADIPEALPVMAAGVGSGSQAHGNDDAVSRDHSWGPSFVVWLAADDHHRFGARLAKALSCLPVSYDGQDGQPGRAAAAIDWPSYLRAIVGVEAPPTVARDWMHIPEEYLFETTPSRVFYDPRGAANRFLGGFQVYPDDVRKQRLAACLAWMNEWGRKHLYRAEQRGDTITAAMHWARYVTHTMKVGFLLSRRYAPYHSFGENSESCRLRPTWR